MIWGLMVIAWLRGKQKFHGKLMENMDISKILFWFLPELLMTGPTKSLKSTVKRVKNINNLKLRHSLRKNTNNFLRVPEIQLRRKCTGFTYCGAKFSTTFQTTSGKHRTETFSKNWWRIGYGMRSHPTDKLLTTSKYLSYNSYLYLYFYLRSLHSIATLL